MPNSPIVLPGIFAFPSSEKVVYNPKYNSTPVKLKRPLSAFTNWLKSQQRKIGGEIGDKIYAKQQGSHIILYIQTSQLYNKKAYDLRFSLAEDMWQTWGFECVDSGVAHGTYQAHIVLLDNNRIVGGSSKNDSSNIWVKK